MLKLAALFLTTLTATSVAAQNYTAVLDDGTRIDVLASSKVGSFLVTTEFGRLRSQGEQISQLLDTSEEIRLLEPLRNLDYAQWVSRLSERGHLLRLAAETPSVENRALLFEALRIWGHRLDPLPPDTERKERVAALWERAQQTNEAQLAFLVGALETEISSTYGRRSNAPSLVSWRKVLGSKHATQRWAAVRLAAVQRDANTKLDLLEISLTDPDLWVALEAGYALYVTDPEGATYRWAYEMVTSRSKKLARHAATQLAKWSRPDARTARFVASRLRGSTLFQQRNACGTGGSLPYGNSGSEITKNSVLEVASPSTLVMTFLADTIQRVADSAEWPVPAPEGVLEEATPETLRNAQAEAWRKAFLGR